MLVWVWKKNLGLKDFEPNFSQVFATITKSLKKFDEKFTNLGNER